MARSGKITDSLDQFADLLPGFLYQLERSPADVFRFRYVSSGMQRILGVSPAEALADADGVLAMIHPDDIDRVIGESMQTAAELRPWHGEFRMHARDGRLIWIEAQDLPVQEPDGTICWSGYANDVSEKKLLEQKIRDLARFDGLTGLPNRQNFIELVENNLLRARRNRSRLALFFVDLDRFKPVNDSFGHAAGDELLKAVAARLRRALRENRISSGASAATNSWSCCRISRSLRMLPVSRGKSARRWTGLSSLRPGDSAFPPASASRFIPTTAAMSMR